MNITEGKCKNETPIYSNWLVHMYTHIVIRSIYSVYTDFSIYGFGMELGDLYNNNKKKNKNQNIMSLQVTHTWLMTEILQIVANEGSNPFENIYLKLQCW